MPHRNLMPRWFDASIKHKLSAALALGLIVASTAFLALFVLVYDSQIKAERSHTVQQLNLLLRNSLENAMLKRDLPGLAEIVRNLGRQTGVAKVMVLSPEGEVRFASDARWLGTRLTDIPPVCPDCKIWAPYTRFMRANGQQELLRGVHPVPNQVRCQGCHGTLVSRPINGILVVDFDASPLRHKALQSAALMLGAGVAVTLLTLLMLGVALRRWVIRPVVEVSKAAQTIASGTLSERVAIGNQDEIGQLAVSFNAMADSVEQSLERLRGERAFLQALIDAVPDGVRVINQDYRVVLANRAYCELTGIDLETVLARPCHAGSHSRAEPCPPTLEICPLAEIRAHGEPLKCMQHFETPRGARNVEINAAPLPPSAGDADSGLIVEVIRDLAAAAQFSHEQRLSSLGQLAAGVAHEIRNPLSSVRLALQTILKSADTQSLDMASLSHYLEVVDTQVDNCVAITDRLLQMSAHGGGAPQLVEINQAVSDTVSLLAFEAEHEHIAMTLSLDTGNPRVIATESDIRMLVLNLLQNAFHAMPGGGGLTVSSRVLDDEVVLTFEDNGSGITSADMPHVFEPFFSRRADGMHGTGLGLAIVKSIVERYHGRIAVHSKPAQGSRFSVTFPLAEKRIAQE